MAKRKVGKTKTEQVTVVEEGGILYWIAFWGLAILLFVAPFFRGMFFALEQQKALLFLGAIFWLVWFWKWRNREYSFFSHPLDFLALGFTLAYLLSTVFAVNKGLAVDGTIAALLCFLVYWIVVQLVRGEADAVRFLHVFYVAGIVVALAGLATSTGLIDIKDGFLSGRIYGPFQYPNALASYLAAIFFLGVYLWHRSLEFSVGKLAGRDDTLSGVPDWLQRANPYPYLYGMGNFLILAVFIGARSIGGFTIIAISLLLFMIGLPRSRDKIFLHILITAPVAFFAISRFLLYVKEEQLDGAWLWILLGIGITVIGQLLVDGYRKSPFFNNLVISVNKYKKVFLALIVFLMVAISFIGVSKVVASEELQDQVKSKIKVHNLYHRVYFIGDAVEMIKDRPVLGWGGGGWEEAYRSYQSYFYDSNEVHSYYGQLGVEIGLLGLLITALILFFFLRAAHRVYYGSTGNWTRRELLWAVFIAAIVLSAHALVDFDLSLLAIAFVWWSMFAIAGKLESIQALEQLHEEPRASRKRARTYQPRKNTVIAAATLATLVIICAGGALVKATSHASVAYGQLQRQNLSQAIVDMEKATKYNPFNPDYYIQLAQYYDFANEPGLSLEAGERGLVQGKYLADRYNVVAMLAQSQANNKRALECAEKAVELAPFQIRWFEELSRMYFVIGVNELANHEIDSARELMVKAVGIPSEIQGVVDSVPEEKVWLTKKLKVTPSVNMGVGIAQYFLGDWDGAMENLEMALKGKDTKGETSFWISILYDKLGDSEAAEEYYRQAEELVPGLADNYDMIAALPLLK